METKGFLNTMKVRKIFLRPVGKTKTHKFLEKGRQMAESRHSNRMENAYEDEETPLASQQKITLASNKLFESTPKFNVIEDPRESSFSHHKFIFIEKINFLLVALTFILEIIKTQIDMAYIKNSE